MDVHCVRAYALNDYRSYHAANQSFPTHTRTRHTTTATTAPVLRRHTGAHCTVARQARTASRTSTTCGTKICCWMRRQRSEHSLLMPTCSATGWRAVSLLELAPPYDLLSHPCVIFSMHVLQRSSSRYRPTPSCSCLWESSVAMPCFLSFFFSSLDVNHMVNHVILCNRVLINKNANGVRCRTLFADSARL